MRLMSEAGERTALFLCYPRPSSEKHRNFSNTNSASGERRYSTTGVLWLLWLLVFFLYVLLAFVVF